MIIGNMVGGRPSAPKACTFFTNSGQEIQAVLVESEAIFTAEPGDVRKGKTFANNHGVRVGTADILDYNHVYAYIDSNTLICLGVFAGNAELNGSDFVAISAYDVEYSGKYYNNGAWYEDAAGTIPWSPSSV